MTNQSKNNRFMLTTRLDKKQMLSIVNEMELPELIDLIDFTKKDNIVLLIEKYTKGELQEIIYNSKISIDKLVIVVPDIEEPPIPSTVVPL